MHKTHDCDCKCCGVTISAHTEWKPECFEYEEEYGDFVCERCVDLLLNEKYVESVGAYLGVPTATARKIVTAANARKDAGWLHSSMHSLVHWLDMIHSSVQGIETRIISFLGRRK